VQVASSACGSQSLAEAALTQTTAATRAASRIDPRRTRDRVALWRQLRRRTCETLPSPCWKTSLTRPLPGANQLVRRPLPHGKPACFSVVRTTTAENVPAGTVTFCTPTTRELPTTP